MQKGNRNNTIDCSKSALFFRKKGRNYTTSSSPNTINKYYFNKTNSFEKQFNTQNSLDLSKKSVCEIRYYMQVQQKKMRNALISRKFEESNISPELSRSFFRKGMKGSKLHNKKAFRKNKYVQLDEVGCLEPPQSKQRASSGLIARYNKPNLMYNLDLFRKKYSKDLAVKKDKIDDSKNDNSNFYSKVNWHSKKQKQIKTTSQQRQRVKSLSQRQMQ